MEYKTLIQIYQSDPGLQKEFPDITGRGVSGNWTLNDWWNKYGRVDYPNVTLVQPEDSRLTEQPEQTTARFEGRDKVYLYDKENKTYRPIDSPQALQNLLGTSSLEEAFQYVTVLSSEDRNTPEWAGNIISESASIKDDGAIPEDSPIVEGSEMGTTIGLQDIYGKTKNEEAEKELAKGVGFVFTSLKQKGAISKETFDKYLKFGSDTLAKYVSAWLYGGYDFGDLYRDLKAKELADDGDEKYTGFKGFDENMSAEEWYLTEEGEKSRKDSILAPPLDIGIDQSFFNNPIFKIPDEAFQTLVQPLDITSPEFKEEAEKIQASYYDIMMQKAEAETEQAKAVADNNWEIFKKNIQKKLGIELSNNAQAAWGQLQEAFSGFIERGLGDSGLFNEAMDKYLGNIRDNDQLKREGKIENEEMELRNHLLKSGSSKEIADFIAENGEEKAREWGLIPDADTLAWFNKDNLKSLYPDMSDEEIATIIGMVVDESGNFKSELQQNLYTAKYNLGEQKKTYQQQKLQEQKLIEEEEAYRPYTTDDSMSSWLASVKEDIDIGKKEEVPTEEILPVEEAPVEEAKPTIEEPSAYASIRNVFGAGWKPSPTFEQKGLIKQGIYGAVRIPGTQDVYTIGPGGRKETAESYLKRFGTSEQKGIVGEVSAEQAKKLGIQVPTSKSTVTSEAPVYVTPKVEKTSTYKMPELPKSKPTGRYFEREGGVYDYQKKKMVESAEAKRLKGLMPSWQKFSPWKSEWD